MVVFWSTIFKVRHPVLTSQPRVTTLFRATYTLPSDVNTELNILSNSTRGLLDALHFNGSLLVSVNPDRSVTDARFDVHIIGSDTAVLERLNLCFHGSVRSKPGIAIYVCLPLSWYPASLTLP